MWSKKEMNIHDKEIIGFLYKKNDQLLVLLEDIPNEIIKLFPCINPFIEDKEIYNFYYINSSVGLEGIVITKK